MRQPLTDSPIMEDTDKVYTNHNGHVYRIEHVGMSLWKIITAGAQPEICNSNYTTRWLAERALTQYLLHSKPKEKPIFITEAMKKRRALEEEQALASREND